jgi:hypothetical protein
LLTSPETTNDLHRLNALPFTTKICKTKTGIFDVTDHNKVHTNVLVLFRYKSGFFKFKIVFI